ncbi:uncharacterized protein LOC119399114 [Rhipicephalus sanguineus]|uniref:uncharacterized protein LOC119399114 n=1 Tax=Rhipicephalus sanguineus TaxID=34632 RepID=UPI001892EEF4|nr:uncharacterized protein LOC119399114 [Rhipicephalus sanguineus]
MTAATLPVDPAVVGTVLYRPSTAGGSFKGSPRLTLAQALSSHAGVSAIRINHKRNIVAADATTKECLEQLLAIRELQGIPVSAREPSDRRTSTGFLHGIDGEPSDASLLPGIVSSVPVMSATREGSTVTLRFSGPVPPEYVSLFRVQFRVRPARPRPLQCRQCGRFGHVKETCDWPQSCINCGQAHRGDEGCQRRRCVNCGGPHSADTPACPRWQQERRVATIMASSTAPLSRKGVRAAVREELQQDQVPRNTGRSYASVLQGSSMPAALEPRAPAARTSRPPRPTVGSNIQGPAAPPLAPPAGTVATPPPAEAPAAISSQAGTPSGPAATSQPTGDSGGPAATTRPPPQVTPGPAATTEVQQAISSLAEILLQAMRIACATLPADHPLRPICLQAVALQSTTTQHGPRRDDLAEHLLQSSYDVLALQEVYARADEVRLPGYVGYSSRTGCTLGSCHAAPCLEENHPQGNARCAIYVRRELAQAEVTVADLAGGPFECCAVRVRVGGVDTTVASVYIRPSQPWDPSCLLQLATRLGSDFVLCGDVNAHHPTWGGRRTCARGRRLHDVLHQLGLQLLNTGVSTFIRRGANSTETAIDLSLATESCRYHWAALPDTWGSDHFPLLLTPFQGSNPRCRQYQTTDWKAFRSLMDQANEGTDFLQQVAENAKAAAIHSTVPDGKPAPDLRLLRLRAARRRLERKARRALLPELWTAFRRLDAVCRRHARRRRRQSWRSVCSTISRNPDGARAWRLLRALLASPRGLRQALSVAVLLCVSITVLVERLANRFADRPPVPPALYLPATTTRPSPTWHHPAWMAEQIRRLCSEPIQFHELEAALEHTRRRGAPGADGITGQMLRNLARQQRERLLEQYNSIWSTGVLPDVWLTAVVVPLLKPRKPATAITSYRPVSLTSAACKVMERIALARLEWIATQLQFFAEQQTGFRRHRSTADSIADVVATLEDARGNGEVAMLLLLDVQSAFDRLPHAAVEAALDSLGISGCLRAFISAFLIGRSFRVRVGTVFSQPRDITTGVPQGSVLSPFLFNLAMAGLAAALPVHGKFPVRCSLYADDVALWVRGPRRSLTVIRNALQSALDSVVTFLHGIGLSVSPGKTEALLVHPLASARHRAGQLHIAGTAIPWSREVTYLGLTIDHRLTWIPAAKVISAKVRRVQGAVARLHQRGQGCTVQWALRLNQAAATSILLYALPLVLLSPVRLRQLEMLHRRAVRSILGLPKTSPIAATLAEAGEWPLSLLMMQRALGHVDRLHRAPDGEALLTRLRNMPRSRMGALCQLCSEVITDRPVPVPAPPPHQPSPEVHLTLGGASKRHTPAAALLQAAACKLEEQLHGKLLVFTDGSVLPDGSAAAACTIPARGSSRQCRLPFKASSTAAELAGLHLAADLLAEDPPQTTVAVLCDSRPALQILADLQPQGLTAAILKSKFAALDSAGIPISFHWLPSHVGIAGNEEADALAREAHQPAVPFTRSVAPSDYSKPRLKQIIAATHPDARVAASRPPKLLPEKGLSRRDRCTLLRLRTGSVWTAARLHAKGRISSPSCSRCGDVETLDHLLCSCPALAQERAAVTAAYRHYGLPSSTTHQLLHPARPHVPAFLSLLEFVNSNGLLYHR